jgi:hypothetical protein
MKQITMAALLLVSIGWFNPAQVRAEAPKPTGGCWSRDVAMRPAADPQAMTTIKGQVVAIDRNDKNEQIAAKEVVTWVRIKTADGNQQSIYLGSDRYLNQQRLKLKVADTLEIQGTQTTNPKQLLPTIVANTIKKGSRVWKINTISSKPTTAKWCQHNG